MLRFIADVGEWLPEISKSFVAYPRRVGDSMVVLTGKTPSGEPQGWVPDAPLPRRGGGEVSIWGSVLGSRSTALRNPLNRQGFLTENELNLGAPS